MKLYKYRSDIHRDLLTLVNNQIYCSTKEQLNDPAEMTVDDSRIYAEVEERRYTEIPLDYLDESYRYVATNLRKHAVFSSSLSCVNELLWAYYADGHHGFCIEYDSDILHDHFTRNELLVEECKVKYEKVVPTICRETLNAIISEGELERLFTAIKSKAWEHEEEYRFIVILPGLVPIPKEAVTGIYFGARINRSVRELIMKSLEGRGLPYYQMRFIPNSYELTPIPMPEMKQLSLTSD